MTDCCDANKLRNCDRNESRTLSRLQLKDYLKSSINLLIILTINRSVNNFLEPKDFSFTLINDG